MDSGVPLKGFSKNGEKNASTGRNENFWKRMRRYFRDYCDSSSIIGFKYLGERRSKGERVLWAALIIMATLISLYYIMEIYYKYEENPFMVTLATRESPIYTIPFPAITICPVVKVQTTYLNFTSVVHRIWDNESVTDEEKKHAQYMSLLCGLDDEDFKNFFTQNETFEDAEFFDTMSYLRPDRTFFICSFMGEFIECSDLFVPIIVDDGICYTFNILDRDDIFRDNVLHYENFHKTSESNWTVEDGYSNLARNVFPRRALLSGAHNSLEVYMTQNVEDSDYLCMSEAEGYSVQIHTPHSIPHVKKQFFTVPLDSSTQVTIKPNLMTTSADVKAYKIKDRLCYFTDERHLKFFKLYTLENCKMECLANHTLRKCGCVQFYLPRDNGTAICGNGNIDCMEYVERNYQEEELEKLFSGQIDKGCNCMPLCTELNYDTETSRSTWKWKNSFAAYRFEERYDFKGFSDNVHFSRLIVFFQSDQFIPSQRNELYGFFDFLSNFGGLLGLFTGFSLLSAVEILYFISVRLWCNRRIYNDFAGPEIET